MGDLFVELHPAVESDAVLGEECVLREGLDDLPEGGGEGAIMFNIFLNLVSCCVIQLLINEALFSIKLDQVLSDLMIRIVKHRRFQRLVWISNVSAGDLGPQLHVEAMQLGWPDRLVPSLVEVVVSLAFEQAVANLIV